jgi:hypothetical protein
VQLLRISNMSHTFLEMTESGLAQQQLASPSHKGTLVDHSSLRCRRVHIAAIGQAPPLATKTAGFRAVPCRRGFPGKDKPNNPIRSRRLAWLAGVPSKGRGPPVAGECSGVECELSRGFDRRGGFAIRNGANRSQIPGIYGARLDTACKLSSVVHTSSARLIRSMYSAI